MTTRKRYALVGTDGRATMFINAVSVTYADSSELMAFCDTSQVRMDYHNQRRADLHGFDKIPTYKAHQFDRMIAETSPETIIVTSVDATHHTYITRAMDAGCDVITEKPMTTDLDKMKAIYAAIDRTGQSLTVTFNYRYAPAYTRLRVAVTGTKGRVEMDIAENINHLTGDGKASASKGAFKSASMRVFPMFGERYDPDVPVGDGGHGGADPVMLEQIFSSEPPPDPLNRAASHIDGAASLLVGISANIAMQTGQTVNVSDLFTLPQTKG